MKFIIHIDAHKTASSLIQSNIRGLSVYDEPRRIFTSKNCAFIDAAHPAMIERQIEYQRSFARKVPAGHALAWVKEFEDQLSCEFSTAIYSNENICGGLPMEASFYHKRDYFAQGLADLHLSDPHIVIYIRRQPDWLRSWYTQFSLQKSAKTEYRSTIRFDEYLQAIDLESLSWEALIEPFRERFGDDRITVIPFELIKAIGGQEYVNDFSRRFWTGDPLPFGPYTHLRTGLSNRAVNVVQAAKPFLSAEEVGRLVMFVEEAFPPEDGENVNPLPDLFVTGMLDFYRSSNERVFSRHVPAELQHLFERY